MTSSTPTPKLSEIFYQDCLRYHSNGYKNQVSLTHARVSVYRTFGQIYGYNNVARHAVLIRTALDNIENKAYFDAQERWG